MEKKKKLGALRFRLIASIASLCACLLIVGASVFAATVQVTTVNDSVTITSEIAVAVKVEQKNGDDDLELLSEMASDSARFTAISTGSFSEIVDKDADLQSATGNGLAPEFSFTNAYTYTVYKITMKNAHTSIDAEYTIALDGMPTDTVTTGEPPVEEEVPDNRFEIYYFSSTGIADDSILEGDLTSGALVEPTVIYIVIAINVDLTEIEPLETTPITLTITCNAKLA